MSTTLPASARASVWSWVTKTVVQSQLLVQTLQLHLHALAQPRIQVRQRLVEEQHVRLGHDRACQGGPLLLPPRKLARIAVAERPELDQLQCLAHPRGLPGPVKTVLHAQREADVLEHRHVG